MTRIMAKPKAFIITLSEENLVYFSGSSVEGSVVLELSAPKSAQKIFITLSGTANVYWTESYTTGSGDNRQTHTRVYSDTQAFFNDITKVLWGDSIGPTQELAAGRHEFPFKLTLPMNSTLPTSFESRTGHIRYTLLATLRQSWEVEQNTKRAINVNEVIDINTPSLREPLSGANDKNMCCLCCTSGPISLTAKTDRGGYCPGESIAISIEAQNHSNVRMKSVRATLKQKIVYHTLIGDKVENKIIHRIEGPGIRRRGTSNWNNELLTIPATIPSITTCRCIKVSYTLTVTVSIPGAKDLHVNIPIKIGNVPFQVERSESVETSA